MARLLDRRRNVLLVAVCLLLLLDIGRSLYTRAAYSTPYEQWRGEPYDLKMAVWPPGDNVPDGASLGQQVYVQRCAVCHGTDGDGAGVAAPSMFPRPHNFTLGQYKYKTTAPGQPPSDADLVGTVRDGLHASAMPYFRDLLTDAEIKAVAGYVKRFSKVFDGAQPEAIVIPLPVTADDASMTRGKALFAANCAGCHGSDGRAGAEFKDASGAAQRARDLTAPWTFRGGSRPEQLWLRLTTGLAPGPMPSFAETLTAQQRWDTVNYLVSIARPAPWAPGGLLTGPRTDPDLVKRGEYITRAEICGLCHTQVNPTGIYRGDDHYLSGGMQVRAYPHGVFVSGNLTSDRETGLGRKSEAEIAAIIRNGRASDRSLNFFGMPWPTLHSMSEDDARAVARYLKTLPPVRSQAPRLMKYGFIETVVMTVVRGLPAAPPEVLAYAAGTYADPDPGPIPADWPRILLVWGQWLVLAGGVALFVAAEPGERRPLRSRKRWALAMAKGGGLLIFALAAAGIYSLPTLLPADLVAESMINTLPRPLPTQFNSPEQYAMAVRGRYVYASISCAFCHGNDGAGGSKINGLGMGTLWVSNISQHPAKGIGSWTNEAIARAIRSGVGSNGRPLHWQGMPWDHFSNLDEEDVQSLIVFLRLLPPVDASVPDYRPPAPGDCEAYTFWVGPGNVAPGCN